MKRIITATVALSVILAFTGCSGVSNIRDSVLSGKITEKPRVTLGIAEVVEDETIEAPYYETYATETEYEPIVTEAETEPAVNDAEFNLGTISGSVYENDFIGIGCNLDSDWRYYSDAEIRQLNNITTDILGDEYKELMESADVVYDMYAINQNGIDSINVTMEKANSLQILLLDINENYKKLAPEMIELYESMGYTNISYTIEDIYISGKSFPAMKIKTEINGVSAYFLSLSLKCNGYLAGVTVGTFYTDYIDDILLDFYLT